MSWGDRRKATYLFSFFIIISLLVGGVVFYYFHKSLQNSQNQVVENFYEPVVLSSRLQKIVSSGIYNILAFVKNPNIGYATDAYYNFKIYDKDNNLLYDRTQKTFIPSISNSVVFDDGISLGDKIPARVDFTFVGNFAWKKFASRELSLIVLSKDLSNEDVKPRVNASIKNNSLQEIDNILPVVVLYDEHDNAAAFSKTQIDAIKPGETQNIVFTWPEPFSSKIYKIEILSKVLP